MSSTNDHEDASTQDAPTQDTPLSVAEARAQVEAARAGKRAEQLAMVEAYFSTKSSGYPVIIASWIGTAAFVIVTIIALIAGVGEEAANQLTLFFLVSVAMFGVGSMIFAIAVMVAAARSRFYNIGMGGLFFLVGTAPRQVQIHLLSSLAIQVIVSIVAAALHPFTPLAFGTLAPVFGLGLCGLWGARFGMFSRKEFDL